MQQALIEMQEKVEAFQGLTEQFDNLQTAISIAETKYLDGLSGYATALIRPGYQEPTTEQAKLFLLRASQMFYEYSRGDKTAKWDRFVRYHPRWGSDMGCSPELVGRWGDLGIEFTDDAVKIKFVGSMDQSGDTPSFTATFPAALISGEMSVADFVAERAAQVNKVIADEEAEDARKEAAAIERRRQADLATLARLKSEYEKG